MPALPQKKTGIQGVEAVERGVLKTVTGALNIHPQDVVVLQIKFSQKHKGYDPQDRGTWGSRQYLFMRGGMIYELYLDIAREEDDADPIGMWAEARLVDFPTEEMAARFAQIAARRAARGGQKRIIPVGHPQYDAEADNSVPDIRGVKVKRVSIAQQGQTADGLMQGSHEELAANESVGDAPDGRLTDLGAVLTGKAEGS